LFVRRGDDKGEGSVACVGFPIVSVDTLLENCTFFDEPDGVDWFKWRCDLGEVAEDAVGCWSILAMFTESVIAETESAIAVAKALRSSGGRFLMSVKFL